MKKLQRFRKRAYKRQGRRCFYCTCEMWVAESIPFQRRYGGTAGQAKAFRCTAEHVIAKSEGGKCSARNIVAACLRCNSGRHARKHPKSAAEFAAFVRARLLVVRWHCFDVRSHGLAALAASLAS